MDLRTLDDLLALIEGGSISRAAGLRNVSQPAFSRRIAAIEAEIGSPLLNRDNRPAAPLPVLIEHRGEMERLAGALRRLRVSMGQSERLVHVCAMHSIGSTLLPAAIAHIDRADGPARIRLRSRNRDDCYAMLMTDQASVMLAYEASCSAEADRPGTEKVALCDDRLTPVVARRTADGILQRLETGEPLPLIDFPEDAFFGAVMRARILPRLGSRLTIKAVSTFLPAVLAFAVNGVGIAWVPARLAEQQLARGELVDFGARLGSCPLSIVMLRKLGGGEFAAEREWQGLREYFSKLPRLAG